MNDRPLRRLPPYHYNGTLSNYSFVVKRHLNVGFGRHRGSIPEQHADDNGYFYDRERTVEQRRRKLPVISPRSLIRIEGWVAWFMVLCWQRDVFVIDDKKTTCVSLDDWLSKLDCSNELLKIFIGSIHFYAFFHVSTKFLKFAATWIF